MDNELKAKNFYRPLSDNQKCQGSDEVGKVLDRIDTDHGSLIAFNEDDDFIGVLSSYKTLYKNHTPPEKKVEHAVIQPMLITQETALTDIANCMASDKVYVLPVFEKDRVIGTISAEDIIKRMFHDENLLLAVADELQVDHPMILDKKAKVKDAYALLRANGVSEVIIVDPQGKVSGVVTRSDIKHAFIHPTDKQRFHHDNYRPDDVSFDAEKRKREDDPIHNYISAFVPMIEESANVKDMILALLNLGEQQYIIIIDKASRPQAILSYRNILEAIARITPEEDINIIIEKPSKNVLPAEYEKALKVITVFGQKLHKQIPIERIEVRINEPKFTNKKTAEYEITLQIDPFSGGQYIAYSKSKNYLQSIHLAMKQIEKQLEKGILKNKKHRRQSLSDASSQPLKQLFR